MSRRAVRVACFLVSAICSAGARGATEGPLVFVARIDTPIHPAAASYLRKTLRAAERDGAAAVILGLSTPEAS